MPEPPQRPLTRLLTPGGRTIYAADAATERRLEELLEAVARGDNLAFEELYEPHRRRVARLVSRFMSAATPADREDVLVEVEILAYQRLRYPTAGQRYADETADHYVRRLLVNQVRTATSAFWKKVNRRPEMVDLAAEQEADLPDSERPGPEPEALGLEAMAAILRCLRQLDPEYREPLILLAAGWRQVDVARHLGLEVSVLTGRVYRARLALRRLLAPLGLGPLAGENDA